MSKSYYQQLIEESNRKLMEIEDRNILRKNLFLKNSVKFFGLNDLLDQYFGDQTTTETQQTTSETQQTTSETQQTTSESQQTTTASGCSAQDGKIKELKESLVFFKDKDQNLTNEINQIPSKTDIETVKKGIENLKATNKKLLAEISGFETRNKELKDKNEKLKKKEDYFKKLESKLEELQKE